MESQHGRSVVLFHLLIFGVHGLTGNIFKLSNLCTKIAKQVHVLHRCWYFCIHFVVIRE